MSAVGRAWYRRVSDPLIGPEATSAELLLGWGTAIVAAVAQLTWVLRFDHWSVLQTIVAVAFAFDIGGGVVVNATRSGRRYWHRDEVTRSKHLFFFAAHVHPFVLAWLWPGFSWAQAAGLYVSMLVFAVVVVVATPGDLKRPVAFGLSAVGLILGVTVFQAPPGLVWLPLMYFMKLIAAHAVPDV